MYIPTIGEKMKEAFWFALMNSGIYVYCVIMSIIFTGWPHNWEAIIAALALIFSFTWTVAYLSETQSVLSVSKVTLAIDMALGIFWIFGPIIFVLSSIPKGITYSIETMNPVGLVALLLSGILLTINRKRNEAIINLSLIIAFVILANSIIFGLNQLTLTDLIASVVLTAGVSIFFFLLELWQGRRRW